MKAKYIILLAVSTLVLVLDQLTKVYIDKTMRLHDSIPVIDGFFSITYLRNKGAAFGILANSAWRLPFFLLVSAVAVLVILVVLSRLRDDQKGSAVSLSLIFSGALGNLIDRVRLGEVIDFLDVYWKGHHWPAFNVADSAICVGVFLLAIEMVLEERREKALKQD
ncbi:signal peptidase [Geoanaerobacter pelophilus]|uniref:Lipoprotein signal peptidase n=1 Tax=Geoanaerobacter pelophilus TaxID=60036 RepID=A0ABQ0MNS4_9BACT|nr:signal peptidase II [Geoanaerobacter pelophilus]GAW68695.1 signal peptidase [Geoanaerobacter pelophilus]